MRLAVTNLVLLPVPLMSGFSGFFPTCFGCASTSQNCSPFCSVHFWTFPFLFRIFPTCSRHKIVPLPLPLISGFSEFFRRVPDASDRHKIVTFLLRSSHFRIPPTFSDAFRMRPAVTKLFPFLNSSHFPIFPDFPDFFRRVPDASHCHKVVPLPAPHMSGFFQILPIFSDVIRLRPAVTKLFPFLFLSFPDFSGFFHASIGLFPTCSGCVPPSQN